MKAFAALLDRLSYAPGRNAKLRLISDYLKETPDPDRGYALAILTGELDVGEAKPNIIRKLMADRIDPVLFALSYDYVGDLSETVALLWPSQLADGGDEPLSAIVARLRSTGRSTLPSVIAETLDRLDAVGRWAFLKMITGSLRVGVSARLAKTALAALGPRNVDEVEEVWHAVDPPYAELFGWAEGRTATLQTDFSLTFRPPMLAHPLEQVDLDALTPRDYAIECKWDGIRVQIAANDTGEVRLFSRSGDIITGSFPDLVDHLPLRDVVLDGELLVVIDGRVQSFATLQQRLNRKTVSAKHTDSYPAHFRAYDLMAVDGTDWRNRSFEERRARLEKFAATVSSSAFSLSQISRAETQEDVAAMRSDPRLAGAGEDADAVEGLMLKRWDSTYMPGRPRGLWWKWKRDPFNVDAVLMYAQRGHGKRSSYYSDYTFGVWRQGTLVPVGKAYFGFTDEELLQIDKFVRNNTTNRFGPVREVRHDPDHGLVFEVAFEGLNRSGRNKSGLAMRFPRISRIRWDKRPSDADQIEVLEAMLN